MDIAPIKTHSDYRRVLREIEGLMNARRNSPEGDRLDVLVTLVEAWERKHYSLDLPDPVEAIKACLIGIRRRTGRPENAVFLDIAPRV